MKSEGVAGQGKRNQRQEDKSSFGVDRKGESSAGALASKDKKRSVAARRDGGNSR